ncbi:MAG: prolipoprotein diacylglyceryl transferase [Deltaproteobacteria bacterium]|nr:prolipoprotein diacylglyceryl transferase [Deltaproteobacteria bacterium]MBW2067901.1 prolipoprotein diacylglyceryl transferase [Deltaproteobacteria bacterium]
MIPYPSIDPDVFRIGPLRIRWYGLMYVVGFIGAYFTIPRTRRSKEIGLSGEVAQDLLFWIAVGLIVGARLGYVLFYQYPYFDFYLSHPLEIVAIWKGGMSFHGGLIGSVVAGYFFCKKRKLPFWGVADSAVVAAPVGLGFGRIGNFINGELFGRVTDVPWAMVFPQGGPLPRHPSQIYEAIGEGLCLFVFMWVVQKKSDLPQGSIAALFLISYGVVRFCIEFFREPDPQIGFIFGWLTMGQILCAFMILVGSGLMAYFLGKRGN